MLKHSLLLIGLAATGMLQAEYVPTSSCVFTTTLTCNLYPSDGNGNFDGNIAVGFPNNFNPNGNIGPGYVVFVKSMSDLVVDATLSADATTFYGTPTTIYDDPNIADWTQVANFNPEGGFSGQFINLYTLGCSSGIANPTDDSCFPTFSTIQNSAAAYYNSNGNQGGSEPALFVVSPGDGGVYTLGGGSGQNTYNFNYISPALAAAPEPSTFVILALGLAGIGLAGRKSTFSERR